MGRNPWAPCSVGFILVRGARKELLGPACRVRFRTRQLVERARRVQVRALSHEAQKIW